MDLFAQRAHSLRLYAQTVSGRLLQIFKKGFSRLYEWLPALQQPTYVGVDEDAGQLAICRYQPHDGGWRGQLFELSVAQGQQGALEAYQRDLVIGQTDLGATLFQELHLAVTDRRTIAQVLPYQLEPLLPFGVARAKIAFYVSKLDPHGCLLNVACTSVEKIEELLARYQSLGLRLDGCTSAGFAALAAHRLLQPRLDGPCLYAVLRKGVVWFILVDHNRVWGAREALMELIEGPLLLREAKKTLLYLQAPAESARCLVGAIDSLDEQQRQQFETAQSQALTAQQRRFFLSLGLALAAQSKAFGQMEFELPKRRGALLQLLSKWHRALGSLATASCAAAAGLALWTQCTQWRHCRRLEQAASSLVQQAQDKAFQIQPLRSCREADRWLAQTRGLLERSLSEYPLLPNTPTLRDALSWLASLVEQVAGGKIVKFEYTMQTRPDPKHPQGRYRVKIEAQLQIFDFEKAHKLQQELMRAHGWIEHPSSVEWKAQKERYKISFYLRDRTVYGDRSIAHSSTL